MRYEQIEINRLGSQGEVKRRIRCLAGHITVFRANDPQLLKLFANGLMGVAVPGERFSVLLDNTPFNADVHPRIGYGERFRPDDVTSVGEFLVGSGVPPDGVDSLLLSHGLGGLAREACKNLSPEEDRMVRLLGIAYSDAGVVILNDPFSLVPETWRNTFARDLSNFAWQKRAIVVVPALSDRPDDWIENEIVSRIQLEAPRKKTIGFGGAGADDIETQKMIEAIRKEAAEGAQPIDRQSSRVAPEHDLLKGGFPSATVPPPQKRILNLRSLPKMPDFTAPVAILGSTFLIAVTATIAVLLLQRPPTAETFQVAAIQKPIEAVAPVEAKPKTLLDGYPEEISAAVTKAFTDPDAILGSMRSSAPATAVLPGTAAKPLVSRRPQPMRPPTSAASVTESEEEERSSADDEAELARRREEIRQRFIEAIQRQSNQTE